MAMVEAMIDTIDDPVQRAVAKSDWQYANVVLRDNPLVEHIGASLGLTKEQLDYKYNEAANL